MVYIIDFLLEVVGVSHESSARSVQREHMHDAIGPSSGLMFTSNSLPRQVLHVEDE